MQRPRPPAADVDHVRNKKSPDALRTKIATGRKRSTSKGKVLYCRRDGQWLVKRAWSKKKKDYYSHRAPFAILPVLVEACLEASNSQRGFSVEDLLESDHLSDVEVLD